jgi:hypothetical protein
MTKRVYLIYADLDPNKNLYLQGIQGTSIQALRCCNNDTKNLLRNNSRHVSIQRLPVLICCLGEQRSVLTWDQLDLAKTFLGS